MYNRYIPNANGIYQRQTIPEPPKSPVQLSHDPPDPPDPCPEQECPTETRKCVSPTSANSGLDVGDLLLLCIILLLLMDSEEEDLTTILITAAAFLFLQ